MNLAWISVAALALAVVLSCTTTINVGVLSLALALIVGVYLGGMSPDAVLAGFPVPLFITLVGVTLLFSIAESNGTLARLTRVPCASAAATPGVLPIMFFAIGLIVATIGAGATPASALLAPPAMAVAGRAGIPPLLMAIMAGHGVLAGTLSPFAPNGIVANGVMTRIGLGGVEWQTFAYTALAHAIVAFGGFFLLGGWRLFKRRDPGAVQAAEPAIERHGDAALGDDAPGSAALIVSVAGFGMNVGMVAIVIAASLILLRTVDEQKAIKGMPWGVILMVTGVTVLIALLEKTEGPGPVYVRHRARLHAVDDRARRRLRHRRRVRLQQHGRRGAAGVPADGARPRAAHGRDRAAADRLVDERRVEPGRSVVALDGRRAVHGGSCRRHRRAAAVQQPARVGAVDVGRGGRAVLGALRVGGIR